MSEGALGRCVDLTRQVWKILCPVEQLNLHNTLLGAQTFRWQSLDAHLTLKSSQLDSSSSLSAANGDATIEKLFCGVVGARCFGLWEHPKSRLIFWSSLHPQEADDSTASRCLRDYFRLDIDLLDLYQSWAHHKGPLASLCRRFDQVSCELPGIRLLRQEPEQCVTSFICSQNNNSSATFCVSSLSRR